MSDLEAAKPDLPIAILGVNRTDQAAYTSDITAKCTFPWLQDSSEEDVWSRWQCVKDDFVILDSRGRRWMLINLGQYNLQKPDNYEMLKQNLLRAATSVSGWRAEITATP